MKRIQSSPKELDCHKMTYKKPISKKGPYKIKKLAKDKKEIEFKNEFDKIGYQEQLIASQKILKCFKENMIENFAKGIVRFIITKDIQDIIDKLEKRRKNILKYDIPFNPNIDIITDLDIINSQILIDFEDLLNTL